MKISTTDNGRRLRKWRRGLPTHLRLRLLLARWRLTRPWRIFYRVPRYWVPRFIWVVAWICVGVTIVLLRGHHWLGATAEIGCAFVDFSLARDDKPFPVKLTLRSRKGV